MTDFIVNFGIPIAYLLIFSAAILSIVFPIMHLSQNPASAKGALIGIAAMVVVFILGYVISSGDPIYGATGDVIGEGMASRITGTGIFSFYIFITAAIAAIVYAEVKNAMK